MHYILTSNLAPALDGVGRGRATAKASNFRVQEVDRSWAGILEGRWRKKPESQRCLDMRPPQAWPRGPEPPESLEHLNLGATTSEVVSKPGTVGHANPNGTLGPWLTVRLLSLLRGSPACLAHVFTSTRKENVADATAAHYCYRPVCGPGARALTNYYSFTLTVLPAHYGWPDRCGTLSTLAR